MKFLPANKTLFGFSLSIILILFIGVSSYLTIQKYDDNANWVNHTYEVLNTIDDLDRAVTAAESNSRAYVLSGDDRYLAVFNESSQRIEYLLDHFATQTQDNPEQTARAEKVRGLIAQRMQDSRRKNQIRQRGTTQDVVNQTDMSATRSLTDEVNSLLDDMRKEERSLLVRRNADMERSKLATTIADYGGTFITLIVVLVLLWYITRTFNEREQARESLQQTNESLERVSAENERRNWILTGASDLTAQVRGDLSMSELSQQVIAEVCNRVGAQIGALYTINESSGKLEISGSFAYPLPEGPAPSFAFKEGLVGQAAFENRPLSVTDVPESYFYIRSGLGEMRPRNVLVWPVDHEDGVVSILELGSAGPIEGRRLDYLRFVSKDIGVAVQMAHSRHRMNVLNDQLQKQAEELQLQQEELQANNEELVRQSEQLQSSEEELRVQQEELMQANLQLEEKAQQLRENVDALEMARLEIMNKAEEVERNSRYKSEFLANMSHELRTPLNSILILAKLLSENKDANLTDKQVEYANVVYKSGQDLLTLINDVLDLSKIEAGRTTVSINPVPVAQVRSDLTSMFREVAEAGKIQFTSQVDPACPKELYTDKDRLEQILRNLLSNAFKFTHEGGRVKLQVTAVNPRTLSIKNEQLMASGQILAFQVTDNGIGIARNKQEVIFEAFRQADGSTNRKYGGTGLGLSISRQLAAMLGGEIRLESTEGEGSTFTLYMPIVHTAPLENTIEQAPAAYVPAEPFHGERPANHETLLRSGRVLLIVEDDAVFGSILEDFARSRGYEVVLATRGDAALHYAKTYRPVAMLLDIQLPVVDGWTVLRRLKADPDTRGIPVHVVSGNDNREKGLELGAINFVHKPLGKGDLDGVFSAIALHRNPSIKKVLIVEDDTIQQQYLDRILREKERDIVLVTAGTGAQAIKRVSEDVYDCIILDLTLPDMSGFNLLEHFQQAGLPGTTKVIVHTSKDLDRDEEMRIRRFTDTIVLKSGRSNERLLDEVALFLHKIEEKTGQAASASWNNQDTDDVLRGKKVLLVDDDMRNVFALSATLQAHGLEVVVAGDGKEGLDKLTANPGVQIVLMDIMMPEMDGYEAMRRIRDNRAWEKLPIIALTAKAMKEDREKCIDAGASDYITKPVDIDQLLSLMRVWLYNSL